MSAVTVDIDVLLADLDERRELAAKKFLDDPLPATDKQIRASLRADIDRHDLTSNVVDLELNGYTILPPGKVASAEFTERLRDTILRIAHARQAKIGDNGPGAVAGLGFQSHHLLPDDPIFEEAIANPVLLTLVTYLAGYRAKIATTAGLVKTNASDAALRWHTDNTAKVATPWPQLSTGANVNWLLTDYSRENGALCVVPGSHNWCREPQSDLSFDSDLVEVITAPAGSVVVWHANLWHAALPRTAPGERVTLVTLYLRSHLKQSEPFPWTITKEMIERNPARFSVLTGVLSISPYGPAGPNMGSAVEFAPDFGRWS